MEGKYLTLRKGKQVYVNIPKNNFKPPKRKRLRKKKMWLYCKGCERWFTKYEDWRGYTIMRTGNKVTGYLCHGCGREAFRKTMKK